MAKNEGMKASITHYHKFPMMERMMMMHPGYLMMMAMTKPMKKLIDKMEEEDE